MKHAGFLACSHAFTIDRGFRRKYSCLLTETIGYRCTAVIAILLAIGLDRYRRSQSQGAVGYRPILSNITESIEGFPAVYRRLLDSYRDIVIVPTIQTLPRPNNTYPTIPHIPDNTNPTMLKHVSMHVLGNVIPYPQGTLSSCTLNFLVPWPPHVKFPLHY